MQTPNKVKIGKRLVGAGEPPYIIAEVGANHNGDMGMARELIAAAKDCGCDAVKFQLWDRYVGHTESYIQELSRMDRLGEVSLKSPEIGLMTVADQLEKFQLGRDQHVLLKEYADSLGIDFASTAATTLDDIDFLVELKVAFLKIASMDTVHPLSNRYIAEKGLPTILSTGLSTWAEVEDSVACFKPDHVQNLILLHCVALYPPPRDDMLNLAKMATFRQVFNVPVGFSDHSIGFAVPLAAIALGAVAIEKHFTLDKNLPGWDHKVSADPAEMKIICQDGRRIFDAIGSLSPEIYPEELKKREHFRRSIVTTQKIRQGDVISLDKIFFKRPGTGILPNELKYVLNRVAKHDIEADELILWDDLV